MRQNILNWNCFLECFQAVIALANGDIFDSMSILATDERRDLAVIQVPGFDLPVLDLANSDTVTVGQPVVIVGSPQGLEGTVTAGILSSVRETGEGFKVLQTDAAVNPGNSGGPLVNDRGQAIGVVSFKLLSAENVDFAIPINYVRGLLNNLHEPMSLEQVRRSVSATSAVQQNSGPSLNETLDWLKETFPLASNHYLISGGLEVAIMGTIDVSVRSIPTRFESCTVSYDLVERVVHGKSPDLQEVTTTRQTIPLGALTEGSISKDHIVLSFTSSFKVDKTLDTWGVLLRTTPKVVLWESHENLTNTTTSEGKDSFFVVFYEESIAQRVLDAFRRVSSTLRHPA